LNGIARDVRSDRKDSSVISDAPKQAPNIALLRDTDEKLWPKRPFCAVKTMDRKRAHFLSLPIGQNGHFSGSGKDVRYTKTFYFVFVLQKIKFKLF
jgi:hypothetical protein